MPEEFYHGDKPIQPPLFLLEETDCPYCGGPTAIEEHTLHFNDGREDVVQKDRRCVNPQRWHEWDFGAVSTIHQRKGCGWYRREQG